MFRASNQPLRGFRSFFKNSTYTFVPGCQFATNLATHPEALGHTHLFNSLNPNVFGTQRYYYAEKFIEIPKVAVGEKVVADFQSEGRVLGDSTLNELSEFYSQASVTEVADLLSFLASNKADQDLRIWKGADARLRALGEESWNALDIAKIRRASMINKPRSLSSRLHQMMKSFTMGQVESLSYDDTLHVLQAWRVDRNDNLFVKIFEHVLKNSEKMFAGDAEKVVDFLYCMTTTRPKNLTKRFHVAKRSPTADFESLLDKSLPILMKGIDNLTVQSLGHLLTALYLSRTEQYQGLVDRIDSLIAQKANELDATTISLVIRAFKNMYNSKMAGSDTTFVKLEQQLMRLQKSINNVAMGQIMSTFAKRKCGTPAVHQKVFMPRIQEIVKNEVDDLNLYANIFYYLMLQDNKDEKLWGSLVDLVEKSKTPMVQLPDLTSYKSAKYYVKANFPSINFFKMSQKFLHAERHMDTSRLVKKRFSEKSFETAGSILDSELSLRVQPCFSYKNLFNVDYALLPMKVGYFVYGEESYLPGTVQPNGDFDLKVKILELCDWKICSLSAHSLYHDYTTSVRHDLFTDFAKSATDEQLDNNISYDLENHSDWGEDFEMTPEERFERFKENEEMEIVISAAEKEELKSQLFKVEPTWEDQ